MGVIRDRWYQLRAFVRTSDNALWNVYQGDNWRRWEELAGNIRGGPAVSWDMSQNNFEWNPNLVAIDVFALGGDGAIWHRAERLEGGWGPWMSLGGGLTDSPAVGLNYDRRQEVFARGRDGFLWHIWQNRDGTWSNWEQMGGRPIVGTPSVGSNNDGRMELFVRGTDGTLLHCWQARTADNGSWSPLKLFTGPATEDAAITYSIDSRMEVFVPSHGGSMRHIWQVASNNGWSNPPGDLGGICTSPAAIRNADRRLEVFCLGTDRGVFNNWQSSPNSNFVGWRRRELSHIVGRIAAVSNSDGRLEVLGVTDVGNLVNMYQDSPGRHPWHTNSIGGATVGGLGRKVSQLGTCVLWGQGWAGW